VGGTGVSLAGTVALGNAVSLGAGVSLGIGEAVWLGITPDCWAMVGAVVILGWGVAGSVKTSNVATETLRLGKHAETSQISKKKPSQWGRSGVVHVLDVGLFMGQYFGLLRL